MSQAGAEYHVNSLITALQQGVRHSLTIAQAVSPHTVAWLKCISRCISFLYRRTHAADADDFENICIRQLRKVSICESITDIEMFSNFFQRD